MITLDMIAQIGIATLSTGAIVLVARKNRWGFVLGLASQPFWIITSYQNRQWGVLLLSVIYIGSWTYGIYEWFYKNKNIKN